MTEVSDREIVEGLARAFWADSLRHAGITEDLPVDRHWFICADQFMYRFEIANDGWAVFEAYEATEPEIPVSEFCERLAAQAMGYSWEKTLHPCGEIWAAGSIKVPKWDSLTYVPTR